VFDPPGERDTGGGGLLVEDGVLAVDRLDRLERSRGRDPTKTEKEDRCNKQNDRLEKIDFRDVNVKNDGSVF
jgi:dephospho-CoA kinase